MYLAVRAGRKFHNEALRGLMRAPMSFYDVQPVGRILNRMTNDLFNIDWVFGMLTGNALMNLSALLADVVVMAVCSPYVLLLFAAISLAIVHVFRFFQASYRELKRLSQIMQSPLSACVSETLTGLPSILPLRLQRPFVARQRASTDAAVLSGLLLLSAQMWFDLRVQLLCALVILLLCLLGVAGLMAPAAAGLALSLALSFTVLLDETFLVYAKIEGVLASAERLVHYMEGLPSEAPRVLPGDAALAEKWPSHGAIEVRDLELRYENSGSGPDAPPPVIRGVSLDIRPGEKVAIVGRTGSGKSTLVDALFRITEFAAGSIFVDGVGEYEMGRRRGDEAPAAMGKEIGDGFSRDISKVGLSTLRRGVQIIPQNPTLFNGTIRSNVDLFSRFTDDRIWEALEAVGLKDFVTGLEKKLDYTVTEGGSNLSSGQRQLLCLSRVLLEDAKIVVLDEATSAIDADADRRVRALLRSPRLRAATVLSIAHRLDAAAAADRVLVLDAGEVAEFATPLELLDRPSSLFAALVAATGRENAAAIRRAAMAPRGGDGDGDGDRSDGTLGLADAADPVSEVAVEVTEA
ncbi:Canalicular multispecific organic anion transporter 2 [Cladochytrium tenue]|nr:Canalicular multispecific organic anion transporter 2 [Cladochytrium tenue]